MYVTCCFLVDIFLMRSRLGPRARGELHDNSNTTYPYCPDQLCPDPGESLAEYGEAVYSGVSPSFFCVNSCSPHGWTVKLHPNAQLPKDFDGVIEANRLRVASDTLQPSSSCSPISSAAGTVSPAPPDAPTSADSEELDPSDDEREAKANVLRNFRRIPVPHHGHFRWHGKSSNLMFLQTVLDLKDRAAGIERPRSADPVFPPFLAPRAPPSVESNVSRCSNQTFEYTLTEPFPIVAYSRDDVRRNAVRQFPCTRTHRPPCRQVLREHEQLFATPSPANVRQGPQRRPPFP